jgi:hypothetical protein
LAIYCFFFCQASTSGRSLNHESITFLAYAIEQFQSVANPLGVFPYAIEKLTVLAFLLSA